MDRTGALPGALEFMAELQRCDKPYFILTNGSAFTLPNQVLNYASRGFSIPAERIISSGGMIPGWIVEQNLVGKQILVLGPAGTQELVREGGGIVARSDATEVDAIVIGNQDGFDFLAGIERTINLICRAIEAGRPPRLLVPNPDVIFPKGGNEIGITCGGIALLIEAALRARYHDAAPQFARLGKPFGPIFDEAKRRAQSDSIVLIGDQMDTDIKGGFDAGIATILTGGGMTDLSALSFGTVVPTYLMPDGLRSFLLKR